MNFYKGGLIDLDLARIIWLVLFQIDQHVQASGIQLDNQF